MTSYFYDFRFEELVAAILHHYSSLPESDSDYYVPVYYWVSAFAVNCNLGSDIRKSPDSEFESVIHRCRYVFLWMMMMMMIHLPSPSSPSKEVGGSL